MIKDCKTGQELNNSKHLVKTFFYFLRFFFAISISLDKISIFQFEEERKRERKREKKTKHAFDNIENKYNSNSVFFNDVSKVTRMRAIEIFSF